MPSVKDFAIVQSDRLEKAVRLDVGYKFGEFIFRDAWQQSAKRMILNRSDHFQSSLKVTVENDRPAKTSL